VLETNLLCRSNVGGIIVAIMMQQLNKTRPDDYLLAMRVLWAPIGLMILVGRYSRMKKKRLTVVQFWIWIPESPWFHARRGNKEGAMRSLRKLYGNVDGFDMEEEYSIIERTIIHERDVLVHAPTYLDCFRGINRVSIDCSCYLPRDSPAETDLNDHAAFRMWTAWWIVYH
jgi:SP family general alpha glucoside:H+ symporter-like MFS transporter